MINTPMAPVTNINTKNELNIYTPSDVMDIARSLQRDIQDRILQGQQLQARLAQFKFRDANGYYWAVEPLSLIWYYYAQGRWNPANPPQGELEGPAHQALRPVPLRGTVSTGDGVQPNQDHVASLAAGLQEIRMAYEQRQIPSTAAEALASLFYLVDKNNRLWTVGFHTGAWYFFDAVHWIRASQTLDKSQLSDQNYGARVCSSCGTPAAEKDDDFCRNCGSRLPARSEQAMAQATAKLVELVNTGVLIPEPVAAPFIPPPNSPAQGATATMPAPAPNWNPVPGYAPAAPVPAPAPMVSAAYACPNCGSGVAPGSKFCKVCGYPIGGRTNV